MSYQIHSADGICLVADNGNVVLQYGAVTPPSGSVGYVAGAIFVNISGSSGMMLYSNEGNAASSNFQLIMSSGSGAPVGATYVVLSLDGDLTNERTLANTANQIVLTDGGAGSTITIGTPQDIHTGATPIFAGADLSSGNTTLGNVLGTVVLPKTLQIQDTSADHQYVFAVNELAADRTVTLPLLTGNDTFTFNDHAATLTNKTLTTPTIGSFVNANHNHQDAAGGGQLDHGAALTGLSDDDHTQYGLLAGRSGGQTLTGGTAASNDLTLKSTSNGTKGEVVIQEANALELQSGTSAMELRLYEPSGSGTNYFGFKAQAQAGNTVYALPAADGTSGQFLSTNGSLTLSWATAAGGLTYDLIDSVDVTDQGTYHDFQAVADKIHGVDIADVITDLDDQNIRAIFPGSPAAGTKFGFFVQVNHTTHGFYVEPADGTSIRGVSYTAGAGGIWSLHKKGEMLIFVYDGSTWQVSYDGRTPFLAQLRRQAAQTISNGTVTKILFDGETFDNGNIGDPTTNNRINLKRVNKYELTGSIYFALADNGYTEVRIYVAGAEVTFSRENASGTTQGTTATATEIRSCIAGDTVELYTSHTHGTDRDTSTVDQIEPWLQVLEILE